MIFFAGLRTGSFALAGTGAGFATFGTSTGGMGMGGNVTDPDVSASCTSSERNIGTVVDDHRNR